MNNYKISYSIISLPTTLGNWWDTAGVFKLTPNGAPVFFMEDAGNINDPRALTVASPLKIFTSTDGSNYTDSTSILFPSQPKMNYMLGAIGNFDINYDGINDIIPWDETENGIGPNFVGAKQFLLLSQPDKSFKEISLTSALVTAHSMSVSDLNKDGKYEILENNIGYHNSNSFLWTVDRNGVVTTDYKISSNIVRTISLKDQENLSGKNQNDLYFRNGISDLNNDGWDDLIFLTPYNFGAYLEDDYKKYLPIPHKSIIYWNDGFGGFSENVNTTIQVEKYIARDGINYLMGADNVSFIDFNGDGSKDIVIVYMNFSLLDMAYPTGSFNCYGVFINDGKGNFTDQTSNWFKGDPFHFSDISGIYGNNDSRIQTGDFNNSGLQSLFARTVYFTAGVATPQIKEIVYLNTGRSFYAIEIQEMNPSYYLPYATNWAPLSLALSSSLVIDPFSLNLTAYSMNNVAGDFDKGVIYKTIVTDLPTRFVVDGVKIATDKFGSAGKTLEILAASFGKDSLNNKALVGIGLNLFDSGKSLQDVADIIISSNLLPSSGEQLVELLWSNIVGKPIDAITLNYFSHLIDVGQISPSQFICLASETELNKINAGLIGVWHGVEYIN